jgi:oxysterol-binding protein-related protein 9/10/11
MSKRAEKVVKPLSDMNELESRKVWHKVTEALNAEEYGAASKEKSDVEEQQRELRRIRKEKDEPWSPNYFQFIEDSAVDGTNGGLSLLKRSNSFDSIKTFDTGSWIYRKKSGNSGK